MSNKILVKLSKQDAVALDITIIELEASLEFYNQSRESMSITPQALKLITDYYMETLRKHKLLWKEILVRYMGEENASQFSRVYRYDMYKQGIFKMVIEGCQLCQEK